MYSDNCHIPYVNPWHESVLAFVEAGTPSLACNETDGRPDLTYVEVGISIISYKLLSNNSARIVSVTHRATC